MSQLTLRENATAPETPASGDLTIYAKADGKAYSKNDAGVETELSGSVDLSGYATQTFVNDSLTAALEPYATETYVDDAIASSGGGGPDLAPLYASDYQASELAPLTPTNRFVWDELDSSDRFLTRWIWSSSLSKWLTARIYDSSFSFQNSNPGELLIPLPVLAIATTANPANPGAGVYVLPSNASGTANPVLIRIHPLVRISAASNTVVEVLTTSGTIDYLDAIILPAEETFTGQFSVGGDAYTSSSTLILSGGNGTELDIYSFLRLTPTAGTILEITGKLLYRYARP